MLKCKIAIIKTKGIILRPITLKDARGYLECHQDKDAKRNFMSIPGDANVAKKEIREGLKNSFMWAIETNGKFAGFIYLKLNKGDEYKHTGFVGFGVHPGFRRKSLATQSLKLITDYGFKKLKLKRIEGRCRTFNKASARVLEKAGYNLEGILRKHKFRNGKYLDDMVWAKLKR